MLRGRRFRRPLRFIALLLVATLIFLNTASGPSPNDIWHAVRRRRHHQGDFPDTSICKSLPGANETVVILKTGSTELEDKLPIHVRTTLKCYPNNLIFSDYAEDFRTLTVLDALKDVSTKYKNHHTDFELYRRLQTSGRSSLDPDELSGPASQPQNGSSGMPSNPGWKLDKWKFLPMIRKTLDMFPEKEWYIFVETDTYMSWSNMLAFLNSLDSSQPYYIGNQMAIGDVLFAHGGSGFAVSRPALERAVGHYIGHKSDWERFVDGHWAGDCVLGKVFYESGTPLNWAWPSLQSDTLGSMNYERTDYDHRLWCYASISWHHLAPEDIEDLWRFEQQRLLGQDANSSSILRHKDVYAEYVLPRTMMPRANWDNQANEDKGPVASLEECRVICEGNDTCVQYSLSMGRCLTAPSPRLGEVSAGVDSGWIGERMRMFYEGAEPCGNEGWTN